MALCDIHLHSHYSDGTWSPRQLVEHAVNLGLAIISLTDHDNLAGLQEAKEVSGDRLKFISGVEISCRYDDDHFKQDFHLLGYFIDENSAQLSSLLEYNRKVRMDFALKLVDYLNSKGIPLTQEHILEETKHGVVGAAHITKAIIASGVKGDITEVYSRYFGKNREIQIDRSWVPIEQAIKAILQSGGIPVLAHPGFKDSTRNIVASLKSEGLMGLEIYHSYHSSSEQKSLKELANELDLVVTGGSDCHGPYEGGEPYMGAMNIETSKIGAFLSLAAATS